MSRPLAARRVWIRDVSRSELFDGGLSRLFEGGPGLCRTEEYAEPGRENAPVHGKPGYLHSPISTRFGILWSQRVEEIQQAIASTETCRFDGERSCLRQRCFFQADVFVHIGLGCFDRLMSQPQCNN
jgi:hypothetical protein